MSLHKEISFENEICGHLGAAGWLYKDGAAARYDRGRALCKRCLAPVLGVSLTFSGKPRA
jgi:hypothetical protein